MRDHASSRQHIDKVVQQCSGFCYSPSASAWWLPCAFLQSFLFRLLSPAWPQLAARFLTSCHLQQADCILVKEREGGAYEGQEQLRVFKLFRRKYVYSPKQETFKPLDAMPAHLPRQINSALDDLCLINTAGQGWGQFNSAQVLTRRNMLAMYGAKRKLFQQNILSSIVRHVYVELFLVQYLEIIYLFYRNYFWLPALLAAATAAAAISLLLVVRQQNVKMTSLVNQRRLTPIVKGGWVRAVSSHNLVPGDVIVLQKGKAMCDMVMLRGSCLVVESMLSGEAAQVRKSAFVPDGSAYDPDKHQSSTVYAGTNVQQVWNSEDVEDEVLAMVCRTGLNTQVGSMVRELVDPSKNVQQKDPFVRDTFMLYAFAFGLQLWLLIFHVARYKRYPHRNIGDIIHWVIDMFVHSAPPSIPTIFLVLTHIARTRLDRAGLSLLYSKALRTGASINMVCFDKTGTLTDSVAALHGVLPVHKGTFDTLQQNAMRWSNRLRQAMAVCNGLALINKTVIGVDLERDMFKAVEARFLERDVVVLPRKPDHASDARTAKLTIQRTLEFSSQTLRSGVVVMADDCPARTALLFVRGAPGPIKDLVQPSSVPENFEEIRDEFSSNSFRMMAMAVGMIHNAHQLDLLHMTQHQIEAHVTHMDLLCLMVLTNNIRPDSEETINQLQHGGGIRTMMITGDYHHTAIAVARDVGMVSSAAEMVIIDVAKHSSQRPLPYVPPPCGVNPSGLDADEAGLNADGVGRNDEGPEEEGKHSLEAQLSMAQNMLGHYPSWGLQDEEDEVEKALLEQKPELASASVDGTSWGLPVRQDATAPIPGQTPSQRLLISGQNWAAAEGQTEAAPEAAPVMSSHSHTAFAMRAKQPPSTKRSHRRVTVPPLAASPSSDSPTPSAHSQTSSSRHLSFSKRQLSSSLTSEHSSKRSDDSSVLVPGGGSALMPPAEGAMPQHNFLMSHSGDRSQSQSVFTPPAVLDHHPLSQLVPSDHILHSGQSLCKSPARDDHTPPHLLMPPGQGQTQPPPLDILTPPSPSQQHMQDVVMHSSQSQQSMQSLSRPSLQRRHPFFSLFIPAAFGHHGHSDLGQTPLATPRGLTGLRFIQAQGNQDCEGSWALAALAEGQLQCAVTGDALDYMLQLRDTSLLEAVIRNAVVFARMKPHQKGQVMDLFGSVGIHQLFDGQPRHIQGLGNTTLFCGDGINDLAALSAADVGMAVGTTDAIVAASLSTHRGSVAGVCSFIKAGKASHSLTASLFKYTMMYQWILSLALSTTFFVDGSTLADFQVVGIDVQAITLAFTACFVPALKQMNRHKPDPISTVPTFILLGSMATLAMVVQIINLTVLGHQAWFHGGTGKTQENPVPTLAWLVANFELLGPLASLSIDTRRFCEPALRFKPILVLSLVSLTLSYIAALGKPDSWGNLFAQYEFPTHFKEYFAWSIALEATGYGIVCHTLRLLLQRFQQGRVSPV